MYECVQTGMYTYKCTYTHYRCIYARYACFHYLIFSYALFGQSATLHVSCFLPPSFLPSFLHSFIPEFLPSFHFLIPLLPPFFLPWLLSSLLSSFPSLFCLPSFNFLSGRCFPDIYYGFVQIVLMMMMMMMMMMMIVMMMVGAVLVVVLVVVQHFGTRSLQLAWYLQRFGAGTLHFT